MKGKSRRAFPFHLTYNLACPCYNWYKHVTSILLFSIRDISSVMIMSMKQYKHFIVLAIACLALLLLLAACGPATTGTSAQPTVTINPGFQSQISPIPTVIPYLCGAWSSNNAPGTGSAITIYARLVKNMQGVSGATATAVVHFQGQDVQLDQATSDIGGYVSFSLPLEGRQPTGVPATVDVTFTNFPGGTLHCTPAFFTPQ